MGKKVIKKNDYIENAFIMKEHHKSRQRKLLPYQECSQTSENVAKIMKETGSVVIAYCHTKHGILFSSKEFTPAARLLADFIAENHAFLRGCTVEAVTPSTPPIGRA